MNESYCIKDKRVTPCVEPSGYQTDKNGRRQFYCHCPVCGIKKVRYVESNSTGKKKPKGDGLMTDVGGIAADALYHHGIPWLAKKTIEMGRYGASEIMRHKKLQKKAVDYGLKKLKPFVYDTAGKALDQLSTKVRPDKKYKTDRKDLDGSGIIDSLLTSGVKGSPWQVDLKKGINLISDPELWAPVNKMPVADAKKLVHITKIVTKKPKRMDIKNLIIPL